MGLSGLSSSSSALAFPFLLFLTFPFSGLEGVDRELPFGASCTSRKEIRCEVLPMCVVERLVLSAGSLLETELSEARLSEDGRSNTLIICEQEFRSKEGVMFSFEDCSRELEERCGCV